MKRKEIVYYIVLGLYMGSTATSMGWHPSDVMFWCIWIFMFIIGAVAYGGFGSDK